MKGWVEILRTGTSDSGKTNVYAVAATSGDVLGHISWYSSWRRYVFYPVPNTLYDEECLRVISEFIAEEMTARRKALAREKEEA